VLRVYVYCLLSLFLCHRYVFNLVINDWPNGTQVAKADIAIQTLDISNTRQVSPVRAATAGAVISENKPISPVRAVTAGAVISKNKPISPVRATTAHITSGAKWEHQGSMWIPKAVPADTAGKYQHVPFMFPDASDHSEKATTGIDAFTEEMKVALDRQEHMIESIRLQVLYLVQSVAAAMSMKERDPELLTFGSRWYQITLPDSDLDMCCVLPPGVVTGPWLNMMVEAMRSQGLKFDDRPGTAAHQHTHTH